LVKRIHAKSISDARTIDTQRDLLLAISNIVKSRNVVAGVGKLMENFVYLSGLFARIWKESDGDDIAFDFPLSRSVRRGLDNLVDSMTSEGGRNATISRKKQIMREKMVILQEKVLICGQGWEISGLHLRVCRGSLQMRIG
jgi:hypothetical protein